MTIPENSPFNTMFVGLELTRIGLEAQAIIAMRTMGMMGLWMMRREEVVHMVAEKPVAFAEFWAAAVDAALNGARPDGILQASMAPISRKTSANHRRLTRFGPRSICG